MKKIFLMALAGTLIVACQKPGGETPENGDTKKVTIAIKKNAATRAQLNQNISEGVYTELTHGTLFFFNEGNNVVMTYNIPAEVLTEPKSEFTVDGVPASAQTVAMIANQTLDNPATWTAFRATIMNIADQASMAAGEGTYTNNDNDLYHRAIQGVALMDMCGYNDEANELTPAADEEGVFEATINLVPAVSRIELGEDGEGPAISVAGDDNDPNTTGLVDFDLKGVYINNYSPVFTLGFEQAVGMFGAGIQPNVGDNDWAEAYKALEPCEYLFDENPGFDTFAYHIFPGEEVPHIIIKADNFVYEDGRKFETPKYWLIDKYYYEDDPETEIVWEPGYVYRIETVLVGNTIPRDDPYDQPVSVKVTVTVEPWHLEYVNVEPK
jgi:hypothetical protein